MSNSNLEDLEKVEKLRRLKFIGDFPKGIEVLLVPLDNATEELKLSYPDLTVAVLKRILIRRNIQILPNISDWVAFQGKDSKRPRT